MQLTVIVPMLHEAAAIPALRANLLPLAKEGIALLLVDGASTDASVALARAAGFDVLQSARGRAVQMNAGAVHTCTAHGSAAQAEPQVLLFLHADTQLPANAGPAIAQSLQSGHCWGRFDVRIEGASPMLRVVSAMMNLRSRLSGIATGDQAMFMTADAYHGVGGFPDQPLMEDIEMSKRLLRLSRPACLRAKVRTSGRRWEMRGVWRTIFLMWQLRFAYWRGTSAGLLAQRYQ